MSTMPAMMMMVTRNPVPVLGASAVVFVERRSSQKVMAKNQKAALRVERPYVSRRRCPMTTVGIMNPWE
jgi:hypothetical protein